jgi:hypothetical protein
VFVFVIGIDPHKGSHTAAVIDDDGQLVDELSLHADRRQRDRLLRFAASFEPRVWAIEGATGVGALLAQQLVGAGETVVAVPAALSVEGLLTYRPCFSSHSSEAPAMSRQPLSMVNEWPRSGNSKKSVTAVEP